MKTDIPGGWLALQRLYHCETRAPERVVLTQPMGGGGVRDFTWRGLMDQARRVAERMLVEHGLRALDLRVYFAESLDTFTADLQRARPTAYFSVPRLWVKFQQGVHAKMPPDLLRWYAGLVLEIVEVYGMTENCGVSHAALPGRPRPGAVGLPYDSVESRVDPSGGEIQVKAACMMLARGEGLKARCRGEVSG